MDNFTLFAGNGFVLVVFTLAFAAADRGKAEPYWQSWIISNLVLATALFGYMIEEWLPEWTRIIFPNSLVLISFGLNWIAARQFNSRAPLWWAAALPLLVFLTLISLPKDLSAYSSAYLILNILVAALSFSIAYEYIRDRADGLQSRYGLAASYLVVGLSFVLRVGQAVWRGDMMMQHMPDDFILTLHLFAALIFSVGGGAFKLSMVFERYAQRLREAASRDVLTGLYNRGAFEREVTRQLEANPHRDLCLALLDLDHFKQVNDSFGHEAGDIALKTFANCCQAITCDDHMVARIGGEEFAILLPGVNHSQAMALVERLRLNVSRTEIRTPRGNFYMTISAGVCQAVPGSRNYETLMRLVDRYLYAAKKAGRDQVYSHAA